MGNRFADFLAEACELGVDVEQAMFDLHVYYYVIEAEENEYHVHYIVPVRGEALTGVAVLRIEADKPTTSDLIERLLMLQIALNLEEMLRGCE